MRLILSDHLVDIKTLTVRVHLVCGILKVILVDIKTWLNIMVCSCFKRLDLLSEKYYLYK